MKNKGKFLFILTLVIVCLLYRVDSVVAMANVQFDASDVETDANAEPERKEENIAEPGTEQNIESTVWSGTEQNVEVTVESGTKQNAEITAESGTEQNADLTAESEPEQITESTPATEYISTGTALTEWLESHKDTGGTVKLADNVVLDGYYSFCPNGVNMPSIVVDTDHYTITVTGEIELLSDDHLTFMGQPDGKSIFYVAEKGMLSLGGVAVESGQCALWQEEGAGLEVGDCRISGSIHYADIPFVMYNKSICVVVEKEQTVNDVLPTQISCTVNRQGEVSYNELVPLSWNLEGTEKQQTERQRFQLQGFFLYAASAEPVLCTVAYNDYPLTITDVEASAGSSWYSFQGGYTKPGENPLITVMSEYSFDGENWFIYEEQEVSNTYSSFYIAFESTQWDMAAHPNVYIRLQCIDNGNRYFSNVLCYTADNLECAQDMGGSRGGGTSIINLPDKPKKSSGDASSENEEPTQKANCNADSDNIGSESPSDTDQTENGDDDAISGSANDGRSSDVGSKNANAGQSLYAESKNTNADQSLYAESENANTGQSLYAESKAANAGRSSYSESKNDNYVANKNDTDSKESINYSEFDASEKEENAAAVSMYVENSVNPLKIQEQTLRSDSRQVNHIVIAIGFVVLSAIAGIVGFCVHSLSGTKR